jgi:transcriptional regulator with XRE-family HTH domain
MSEEEKEDIVEFSTAPAERDHLQQSEPSDGSEAEEPKNSSPFLKAGDPETWEKPKDISWGNYSLKPDKPLTPRQRRVAKLAATGMKQKDIAEKLGYTQGWLSRILTNDKMIAAVEEAQERMYEEPVRKRLQDMSTAALDAVEGILTSPEVALKDKESAARFVIEQLEGKAIQKVDHTGEIGLGALMDKLEHIEQSGQIIDVTPKELEGAEGDNFDERSSSEVEEDEVPAAVDPFSKWVEDEL